MPSPPQPQPFPRFALVGAALVIVVTIVAAAVIHSIGIDTYPPSTAAVASRELHFVDKADGSVTVINAADDSVVQVLAPGTNGFLRATLRGLARDRKLAEAGNAAPFRVTAYADGRVTLEDPATGRRVDLEAFGQTNVQAFLRLLPPRSANP